MINVEGVMDITSKLNDKSMDVNNVFLLLVPHRIGQVTPIKTKKYLLSNLYWTNYLKNPIDNLCVMLYYNNCQMNKSP